MPSGSGPVAHYTRAINDEKLKPIDKIYDEATGRPATRSVDLTNRKHEIEENLGLLSTLLAHLQARQDLL